MNRAGPSLLTHLRAMTRETFQETRSPVLLGLVLLSAVVFLEIGLRLPGPLGKTGAQAGAFFHGAMSLVLFLYATVLGAANLARDRDRGFFAFLFCKPLPGPAYFLGRFLGLVLRLSLAVSLVFLLGGLYLGLRAPKIHYQDLIPSSGPDSFQETDLLLLGENPRRAEWTFAPLAAPASETLLRFRFRPRYPRHRELDPRLDLRILAKQAGQTVLEQTVTLQNRKSLELPLTLAGSKPLSVSLHLEPGPNLLEVEARGCLLVQGRAGPFLPLVKAGLSLLPVLYLGLATALFFSLLVSTPTALFAALVLSCLVVMGPSLQQDLKLRAAGLHGGCHHEAEQRPPTSEDGLRRIAAALSCLPDPRQGGALTPLARLENPDRSHWGPPFGEAAAPLFALLLLGSLLAMRRRS